MAKKKKEGQTYSRNALIPNEGGKRPFVHLSLDWKKEGKGQEGVDPKEKGADRDHGKGGGMGKVENAKLKPETTRVIENITKKKTGPEEGHPTRLEEKGGGRDGVNKKNGNEEKCPRGETTSKKKGGTQKRSRGSGVPPQEKTARILKNVSQHVKRRNGKDRPAESLGVKDS